jgi:hypothetical protein
MLILLMGGIYDMRRWDGFMRHDTLVRTKFHEDWFRHLSNITVITSKIWEAVMSVLLIEEIYEVRCWNGFM